MSGRTPGAWSERVLTPFDGAAPAATAQATRPRLCATGRGPRATRPLEVTSRVLDVATAEAVVRVADRALEAAKEAARVERDRYQEGVTTSADLLDAETRLLRAGVDRTSAVAAVSLARARLDRAVGVAFAPTAGRRSRRPSCAPPGPG
jgi:hypothetical protein